MVNKANSMQMPANQDPGEPPAQADWALTEMATTLQKRMDEMEKSVGYLH